MGLFGKTQAEKFKEACAVAPENEPYLCYGVVLMAANEQPADTLVMQNNTSTLILRDTWDISSAEQAKNTIGWLLNIGDRPNIEPVLQSYRSGDLSAINSEVQKALTSNIKDMVGIKMRGENITNDQVSLLASGLAWDVERAAFVARLAFNASYISEQDTWAVLKMCKKLAGSTYRTWTDYLVSYILGRSVVMGAASTPNSFKIFNKSGQLLNDSSSLWATYPQP